MYVCVCVNELYGIELTCKYKIPLHIDSPRNHVSVTSHTTVGGKHNMITSRSAMAKFTMNILVTVRIVAFAYTAMHTNILPICDDFQSTKE